MPSFAYHEKLDVHSILLQGTRVLSALSATLSGRITSAGEYVVWTTNSLTESAHPAHMIYAWYATNYSPLNETGTG